jgi:hypothetical protein
MTDMKELENGSFISVGSMREASSNHQKAILIKSDSLGNEIWKKTYRFNSLAHSVVIYYSIFVINYILLTYRYQGRIW